MRRSSGRVFGSIIQHHEIFLAKLLISLKKPVNVKGAAVQFLRRERRVLRKTGHFKILFNHWKPLLCIHGKFHKTLLRDVGFLQCQLQILRRLLWLWHGNFQQMTEHMASVPVNRTIITAACQRVFAKRCQNLYHIDNAVDHADTMHVF